MKGRLQLRHSKSSMSITQNTLESNGLQVRILKHPWYDIQGSSHTFVVLPFPILQQQPLRRSSLVLKILCNMLLSHCLPPSSKVEVL